jgi:hypothetical protein
MSKAQEIVTLAKAQMQDLIGFPFESVSSLGKIENGWRMVLNVVELRRIPASTDVLAAYEITLDEAGNVTGYHRERRYLRDQTSEEGDL